MSETAEQYGNPSEKSEGKQMTPKEMDSKEQELQEIAERLMQSENLAASVEILREFAEKCWQEGACEAQNDAAKYINEHTVNYRDIPNVLFTGMR